MCPVITLKPRGGPGWEGLGVVEGLVALREAREVQQLARRGVAAFKAQHPAPLVGRRGAGPMAAHGPRPMAVPETAKYVEVEKMIRCNWHLN